MTSIINVRALQAHGTHSLPQHLVCAQRLVWECICFLRKAFCSCLQGGKGRRGLQGRGGLRLGATGADCVPGVRPLRKRQAGGCESWHEDHHIYLKMRNLEGPLFDRTSHREQPCPLHLGSGLRWSLAL